MCSFVKRLSVMSWWLELIFSWVLAVSVLGFVFLSQSVL
jgi:hypothetical protein